MKLIMQFAILYISLLLTLNACATTAVQEATEAAKIAKTDPLDIKVKKALALINDKHYYAPNGTPNKIPPPYNQPYHLDSMRTAEEVFSQKIGGYCESAALTFAALLQNSGFKEEDMRIVFSVTDNDLKIICPKKNVERVKRPKSGASGHVFVALRYPDNKWRIINTVNKSKNYDIADWYEPQELGKKMAEGAVALPLKAYRSLPLPKSTKGFIVFQDWPLKDVPKHSFVDRLDLIASGKIGEKGCRLGPADIDNAISLVNALPVARQVK
jgi:hypothetical protein